MKTSFSRIAIMAAGLMFTAAAQAEYLYAFIGDDEGGVLDYTGYNNVTFDYATFSPYKGSTDYLKVNGVGNAVFSDSSGTRTATSFTVGDDNTTFNTFVVELWLTDGESVGWQEYTRTQIASSIFKDKESGGGSGDPFYITQVIPEPSSALLMLFGLAGLVLRRRRI